MKALCLLALAACLEKNAPGTLPGEAQSLLQASVGSVKADTAGTTVDGTLSTLRYSGGAYFAPTRFGAISGAEITAALGYLVGDENQSHTYLEMEAGGVIQPFPFSSYVHLAADFGAGFNLDDRYVYAGARLGINLTEGLSLDADYRRHFGDVPGNVGAYEDRVGGGLTIKRAFHVGVEYTRGDQRTIVNGVEMAAPDYLLQGRYTMLAITVGYAFVADHPRLTGIE